MLTYGTINIDMKSVITEVMTDLLRFKSDVLLILQEEQMSQAELGRILQEDRRTVNNWIRINTRFLPRRAMTYHTVYLMARNIREQKAKQEVSK
jgi:hypothetical protein